MRRSQIAAGVAWAGLITATELVARRTLRRRAHAWLLAYTLLGATSLAFAFQGGGTRSRRLSPLGLAIATFGYPLGRRLLRDPSTGPPPD
ncbi:MAG: hypothetical protein M3077_15545, partial [Candidatus Dormibacteraeota bacterium]|nr:hypothetical protein [Candidatus Dormibacteraeota bacterium]